MIEIIIQTFVILFVMINPISVLFSYLGLTEGVEYHEKRTIINQAILFSFLILVTTTIGGRYLLELLGLQTYALQIAGGILFFKFGYDTLNGTDKDVVISNETLSFVPLGFPIIAGPGSITAIIIFTTASYPDIHQLSLSLVLLINIMIVLILNYVTLRYADRITRLLGKRGTIALLKLMGLLIMTIGVDLVLSGLGGWLSTFSIRLS